MMALPDELMSTIGPIIDSVGAAMSKRYWQYGGTHDELTQAGWLWACEHPKKLILWFDPDFYEPKEGERLLARTLRNHLTAYGEELKAQRLGYSPDDLTHYTRGALKDLLPAVYDDEAWLHPETLDSDSERRGASRPSEGGNWVATLADISRALTKLRPEDQDLLRMLHGDPRWSNNEAAEFFGISKQAMSDRHDRAVKRLLDALGGPKSRYQHNDECDEHCSWGSGRRSISNSQARAMQQSYWDED